MQQDWELFLATICGVMKPPAGLYFEDLTVGAVVHTMGRTITEADVINFMGVSGIFEELHMNVEYIHDHSVFGQRVSPGPLTFVVAEGLVTLSGLFHHTGMALLRVDNMVLPAPVFCGDTIHVEVEVTEKRETSKPDRGIVRFHHVVRKQSGAVAMEMDKTRMIRRAPIDRP
jgi:acyl dehydratase